MDKFEAEMIGMVKEIKFRKMRNNIQQKMYEDMRRIKESDGIFVKSDKSGNFYEIEKGKYKQMVLKEVNIIGKHHQISKRSWIARQKCWRID